MNIELPRKKLDLASAIAEGDIRVLLMVLVHMTGDERWLEPPYQPKRDVRLIPDPQAGVPPEIQDEIRAAVAETVRERRAEARHHRPRQRVDAADDARDARRRKRRAGICAADARGNGVRAARGALEQAAVRREAGAAACADRRRRRLRHRARRRRSAGSASPTPSSRRTPSSAAPGMSTAIPAAASIRRTIPIRSRSAREIRGRAISPSARNCSITSRRSRSNTTSASTCASIPN